MPKVPAIASAGHRDAEYLLVDAAATFKVGAAVVLDAQKEVTECGADPASIYGFALTRVDAGVSKDPQDTTKVLVMKAIEGEKFCMQASSDPVEATHRNNSYGLIKDADGIWTVDFTDTTNTRVFVHRVYVDRKMVEVSVLEANRQIAP